MQNPPKEYSDIMRLYPIKIIPENESLLCDTLKQTPYKMKSAYCRSFSRVPDLKIHILTTLHAQNMDNLLQAVHIIHEARIVHSDLKPANFLMVEGTLKLIDFGIAKAISNDTTSIARESQVGTLNYMSPEAILGGANNIRGGPAMKVRHLPDFGVISEPSLNEAQCIIKSVE